MSTYFSIRCDGPTCRMESHRRLSSPELAIPGAWQVLKLDQGKDGTSTGTEDLHFCSRACIANWADQDAAQTATVPLTVTTQPATVGLPPLDAVADDEPEPDSPLPPAAE